MGQFLEGEFEISCTGAASSISTMDRIETGPKSSTTGARPSEINPEVAIVVHPSSATQGTKVQRRTISFARHKESEDGGREELKRTISDKGIEELEPTIPSAGAQGAEKVIPSTGDNSHDIDVDLEWVRGDYDHIDFSAVFGDGTEKYAEHTDSDDGGDEDHVEYKKERRAPEQWITIFALRLALLEKAASGLGTIAFLWATVVILGGLASQVSLTDFWVVTAIILAESSRIFSRSHELEWHRLDSKSNVGFGHRILEAARTLSTSTIDRVGRHSHSHSSNVYRTLIERFNLLQTLSGRNSNAGLQKTPAGSPASSSSTSKSLHLRRQGAVTVAPVVVRSASATAPLAKQNQPQKRTWSKVTMPLVPYAHRIVTTKVVSLLLYFAQVSSAAVSIALSLWRIRKQKFYDRDTLGSLPNVTVSLNVFYVLSVLEAGLFLLERCYWEYKVRFRKLLDEVRKEAGLGNVNADVVKQFFYDVYSECLKGSVFDGLDMDLVSYGISWLLSKEFKRQLCGARLLKELVSEEDKPRRHDQFAYEALRRLGTTQGIIERLLEMLSWNSKHEAALLREVATILCRLVVYNRNCSRLAAVPGSIDALVSLLVPHQRHRPSKERIEVMNIFHLRLTGLRIVKYLCKDHKNSLKVGETRGLLSILVIFIEVRDESSFRSGIPLILTCQLKTYKKSLQVLGLLAGATNSSGEALRHRIAAIVSGLKNLRDMIHYGADQPELQRLAVEVLYNLAMEEDVRQVIGATGGVLRNLADLFFLKKHRLETGQEEGESKEDHDKEERLASEREKKSEEDRPSSDKEQANTEKERRASKNAEEERLALEMAKDERLALEKANKAEEERLASEMAGQTLARLVLMTEDTCLRLLSLNDNMSEKPLIQLMVDTVKKNESDNIVTSAAQILRSLLRFADLSNRAEVAEDVAPVVLDYILRCKNKRSEIYEACLGLGSRTLQQLHPPASEKVLLKVDKLAFLQHLIMNLKHTPTTNKYPRIRRYSVELIVSLPSCGNSFVDAFRSHNDALKGGLQTTLNSISEVENFCLFSGLVGYTKHEQSMETLVREAMEVVSKFEESGSFKFPFGLKI